MGHHFLAQILSESEENQKRKTICQEQADDRRHLFFNILGKRGARFIKALRQSRVIHKTCLIYRLFVFIRKDNLRILDLYLADFLVLYHLHEFSVIHFRDAFLHHQGTDDKIKQEDNKERDTVIINQRLFW